MPRCFGFNSGLEIGIRPSFQLGDYEKGPDGKWATPSTPTWFKLLSEQDFAQRLAMLDDEVVAAALMAEAKTEAMAPKWGRWAHTNYSQEDIKYAVYAPYVKDPDASSVETLAAGRGDLHPAELWLALNREKRGLAKFYEPFANKLQDVMESHLGSNWCLPGVGDTGAHLSIIIDAGWPSFVLSHWHRERGFYSLGEAVRRMTSAPAHAAAIHGRGLLKVGMKADINVMDLDAVGEALPYSASTVVLRPACCAVPRLVCCAGEALWVVFPNRGVSMSLCCVVRLLQWSRTCRRAGAG